MSVPVTMAFNVVFMPATGNDQAMLRAESIMNNLLRGVVIPNEQAIKTLYQTM